MAQLSFKLILSFNGDFDFSFCKVWVYAQYCGDIFMVKALLKSWEVNVKFFDHSGHGISSSTVGPRQC